MKLEVAPFSVGKLLPNLYKIEAESLQTLGIFLKAQLFHTVPEHECSLPSPSQLVSFHINPFSGTEAYTVSSSAQLVNALTIATS